MSFLNQKNGCDITKSFLLTETTIKSGEKSKEKKIKL